MPKSGSYIDTQGMSGPTDPNAKPTGPQVYNLLLRNLEGF